MSSNRLGSVGVAAVNNIKDNGAAFIAQMTSQGEAIQAQLDAKAADHADANSQALIAMAEEKERREGKVQAKKQEVLDEISSILGTVNSTSLDTVYGLGAEINKADNNMDKLVSDKTDKLSDAIAAYDADLGAFSLEAEAAEAASNATA